MRTVNQTLDVAQDAGDFMATFYPNEGREMLRTKDEASYVAQRQ